MAGAKALSSALLVSAGIFCSRLFGLVRERVFAHYLGNSPAAGAFRAALRIPNVLQNLFGEGSLSASFIPVYVRLTAGGRGEEARKLAGVLATLLCLLVLMISAAGVLAAEPLIDVLAPGFSGEVRLLTVRLLKIIFPGTGLLVLSALCLGVQNSHGRFFLSYAAPVAWNTMIIAALVAVGSRWLGKAASLDDLAVAAAWGTLLGGLMQFLVQVPVTLKLLKPFRFSLQARNTHLKTVITNFIPALVSRGVVQISAYIDQILSSYLGAQIVAALGYAQTLYLLPFSLIGSSLAAAELPEMSKISEGNDAHRSQLAARLTRSFMNLDFFVVPAVVAFLGLGDVVTATIYQTGSFGRTDVMAVWVLLAASALGLAATTKSRVMVSSFWARQDTRTPLRFAALRVGTAALLGLLAVFPVRRVLGLSNLQAGVALCLASAIPAWLEFLLLRTSLRKSLGTSSPPLKERLGPWGAALASCALTRLLASNLAFDGPLVRGLLLLAVFGFLYFALALVMKLEGARGVARRLPILGSRA